jgi:hypothetical protein
MAYEINMDSTKKFARFFLFFCSFFLLGCSSPKNSVQEINYVHFSNKVVNQFCDEMKKKFGLICTGSGGSFAYDIQSISLMFISDKIANREEARKLEVIVVESFLKAINENREIRPYLREHPFTPDRANISISFRDNKKELDKDGDLTSVFQAKNTLFFHYNDSSNELEYRTEKEPYEEALLKVQRDNPELNP